MMKPVALAVGWMRAVIEISSTLIGIGAKLVDVDDAMASWSPCRSGSLGSGDQPPKFMSSWSGGTRGTDELELQPTVMETVVDRSNWP